MTFDLNGRLFRPISNSEGGRVGGDTLFRFSQNGKNITAVYGGPGVFDGHIIGQFSGDSEIRLIYHSRSKTEELEAGEATAKIAHNQDGKLTLAMDWVWLNGSKKSGTSNYIEVVPDAPEKTP